MHLKRHAASLKLPIARKGSAYIVRAQSDLNNSLPVLVAVRDVLKLANTARELKEILKSKSVKLNGRAVKDYHESIRLFNVFEAGKVYVLSILPTGRFSLNEVSAKTSERIVKLTGKKVLKQGKIQLNFHDGTNVISGSAKPAIGDSLVVDFSNKIKKTLPLEEGAEVFVISGRCVGQKGKIKSISTRTAKVVLESKVEAELLKNSLIVQ